MNKLLLFFSLMTFLTITGAARSKPDAPFWTGNPDALTFEKNMNERLALAQKSLGKLLAATGKRTIANTLQPYDDILKELDVVGSQASLISAVHPDAKVRDAADAATQKASAFSTELSLNRAVYDALAALDVRQADPETRYYVEKTLRSFRLAGVDKDDTTRARIKTLNEELVIIGQEFDKNIRSDVRQVTVNSAADLDGLPADYIARHKPDANGKITLTTDYPDSLPVFSYAKSEKLRREMFLAYNNRAYPANSEVLNQMLAKRHELANLLGYTNWADYITADKMAGSAKTAAQFIDRIVAASEAKAKSDYASLLRRKQQDMPGATVVNAWDRAYYSEQVQQTDYSFDSQKVRPYFQYQRVRQGLFDVTQKLFGVTYRRVKDAPVWHPAVECYEVLLDGKLIGRFYLDMHPRADKYKHAAQFNVRTGQAKTQIAEAALVCNLPGGDANDPGLLTHDDVETYFHEFGHLLHALLAGRHRWIGAGNNGTEIDFVEAPSQLLEEWTWNHNVLKTFAKHYQTGEPIPAELVQQMKRAGEFGKGTQIRRQMVFAKLSLSVYDRDPKEVDADKMVKDLTARYEQFPFAEGTHFQTAFGHLDGYSAVYYSYMWSLVIAKDLFSQFDEKDLLAPATARKYRDTILATGASQPANQMVQNFLGRPFNYDAWQKWLNTGD